MIDAKMTVSAQTTKGIKDYLKAGIFAGLLSAILNNIIYLMMISLGGFDWELVVAVSILFASLLPNILAAIAYFFLSMLTPRARLILSIGIVVFILISVLPHLGIGPAPSPALAALPEGFNIITAPLHIVFGFSAMFIMPWLLTKG
jgi:hypothetical protein